MNYCHKCIPDVVKYPLNHNQKENFKILLIYSIILLTENTQKRGWLAFPGLDTWYTFSRHPKTVRIFNA